MGTFHLALSMAGTVSAGTYTGGTLVELNNWLANWQNIRTAKNGIKLKAIKDTANFKKGDLITIAKEEIPDHHVKIKTLTGASGGGISAALFMLGLTTDKVEEFLRDTWTEIDVRGMLDSDDLERKKIYSLLNVKPIDDLVQKLRNERWSSENYAEGLDYLSDNIEIFLTLASYEGIPFKISPVQANNVSYGIQKTHLDYIKFNFSKNQDFPDLSSIQYLPWGYQLFFRKNEYFKNDNNWLKLIESAPATAAFPFGFKPRSLKRLRKEYTGKLFYLGYTISGSKIDYSTLDPEWPCGNPDDDFEMEYIDGGTFNRDPHDLARASLMQSLGIKGQIPHDGINTNACVILLDPFPTNFDLQKKPGDTVIGIPSLFKQPQYFVGSTVDQGRFRPDWIEKAVDNTYYSRFFISPTRRDSANQEAALPLAAGLLGAFSGFLDQSFREHDYKLGRYNTYQFLSNYFCVPETNKEITYCQNASPATKEKYEAIGWYIPNNSNGLCQIIPRTEEPGLINSLQPPVWPSMSLDKWEELRAMALNRAKRLCDSMTDFSLPLEMIADPLIWHKYVKSRAEEQLNTIEKELIKYGLLRKEHNSFPS
ncbi:patatin-like phospholipase family protein [Solitalea lacus]|uniref:patatin-like phospholipase family protein n=1 Tax=Solitalea lacus TaxID=2911172 RepID=UPI001EDB2879|nr:patatin-like phospholipase family protein [Solitalea lacus]UKJ09253.1 patatin-like phospholipase family protein [Solitalea lacus]